MSDKTKAMVFYAAPPIFLRISHTGLGASIINRSTSLCWNSFFVYFGQAYVFVDHPMLCPECGKWSGLGRIYCDDCLERRINEGKVLEVVKKEFEKKEMWDELRKLR